MLLGTNNLPHVWHMAKASHGTSLPVQETWIWSLDWEDPLGNEMATHSSILAWRIPWTEEPGYSPWSCRESDVTEWLTCTHISPIVSTIHQMWVWASTVPQIFSYIFTLCFTDHYPSLYQCIGLAKMFVQAFCKNLWNSLFDQFNSLE